MFNFEDALAEWLSIYADIVRANGAEIEYRGIQYELKNLARIVAERDAKALADALGDLKNWAEELATF